MKYRKLLKWVAYGLLLFIPVVLSIVSYTRISELNKTWIAVIGGVLFLVALSFDIWDKTNLEKYICLNKEVDKLEKILNKSFDIFKEKKRVLMNEISENKYINDIVPYSVQEHMRFIISELKDCVCDITKIDPKNLSVHFMYKHTNDMNEDWKWIDGDNISVSHTLKKIIENENSCYYRVLHTDDKFVFVNDKLKAISEEKYISSDRDKYYGKTGSVVCAKIDCGRYGESYIEAVVSVSSYGRMFVESGDLEEIRELEKTMKYQILPYYNALLEIEMASLSLRHSIQNKKSEGTLEN